MENGFLFSSSLSNSVGSVSLTSAISTSSPVREDEEPLTGLPSTIGKLEALDARWTTLPLSAAPGLRDRTPILLIPPVPRVTLNAPVLGRPLTPTAPFVPAREDDEPPGREEAPFAGVIEEGNAAIPKIPRAGTGLPDVPRVKPPPDLWDCGCRAVEFEVDGVARIAVEEA